MGRKMEEFRIQRNGNSVQLFNKGEYCGSLPLAMLCALAKQETAKDTILESIQDSYIKEGSENGG